MQYLPFSAYHFRNIDGKVRDFLDGEYIPHKIGNRLVLNKAKGDGHLNCVELTDGICLIAYDIKIKNSIDVHVDTSKQNHLYFFYVLQGSISVKFPKKNNVIPLEQFQSMIISSCKAEPFDFHLNSKKHLQFFVIQLDREKYLVDRKNSFASKEMPSSLFTDCDPAQTYIHRCS